MSTAKSTITHNHRLDAAECFKDGFANTENSYYLYAADHTATAIEQPYSTVRTAVIDAYRNMLFGKKITESDTSLLIKRITHTANTVYTPYTDDNTDLDDSEYFVTVVDGSNTHVYKCLENVSNAASTVAPAVADFSDNETVFYPTDGYRWKYMYSVPAATITKFATDEYFPVYTSANVSADSINGAIDVIVVANSGRGYDNYTTGTFSSTDIRLNGNNLVYAINASASSQADFYNNCYLYISSGNTGTGQYRKINDYTINATTKYVTLESAFTIVPENGWTYEINPSVTITGDATQTINAAAMAIINTTGNTVYRIEVLNPGANYKYAAANIYAHGSVSPSSNATLTPIHSPYGGHGSNAAAELGSKYVGINVKFRNNESNTIISTNDYAQIGILKNPLFAQASITFSSQVGNFSTDEIVRKIKPKKLAGVGNAVSGNAVMVITGADITNQVANGEYVYITDGTNHQLTTISTANTTTITMADVALFTSDATSWYIANTTSYAYISGTSLNAATVINISGVLANSDVIIGGESGAYAVIDTVSVNGQEKNFDTFLQTYLYQGLLLSSTFEEDEKVYQGSLTTANADFVGMYGASGTRNFYVTNQVGIFNTSNTFTGSDSSAVASIITKYNPDLVFGSGDIIYIENADPIDRSNTQTETFKCIFQF